MATAKAPSSKRPLPFSTIIQPDVAEALRKRSYETGIPKSRLVDKALRKLLKLPAA